MGDKTPTKRVCLPPNQTQISNSTNKKFSEVMEQYMRVHKITSLNPTVVTQAADYAGPRGDSYHQWDDYNPPTPIPEPKPQNVSKDQNEFATPILDYNFDNWSIGDSLPRPPAPTTEECRDHKLGTPGSTPRSSIREKSFHEQCPTSESAQRADLISESSRHQGEHPKFKFLPSKHHLQLSDISQNLSDTSMNSNRQDPGMTSFWEDYERTTTVAEDSKYDHTPMCHLNMDVSQNEQTTPSDFTNSGFEIESTMEPDSLEKKSIMTSTSICDHSVKKGIYDSYTVASCLPQLLMSEYTESPPYLPSESFNYNVADIQEMQQRDGSNSISISTSQRNIQHSENSSRIRNSFSGSSSIPMAPSGNETSCQPIATPMAHLVFDSLADSIKSDRNKKRNICIGLSIMFIGAIISIIALAVLVKIQNKKFAPYNGMYPNGLDSSPS